MMFTDQLNRSVEINFPPVRIISLVPSQTELLFDLGLRSEVVGITKFCIHPGEWFRTKTRVGGTKKINFDIVARLNPDLIIGNKEENDKTQAEALMEKYPVWMSDIKSLENALEMIMALGGITGKREKSSGISSEISLRFRKLEAQFAGQRKQRVAYFIWRNPFIAVGANTFIHEMLERCGLQNVFDASDNRYPEVSAENLQKSGAELIFLSSEPYPFSEKHINEFQGICPKAKIVLVDGEMFSWYGSRLLKAPEYFAGLLGNIRRAAKD